MATLARFLLGWPAHARARAHVRRWTRVLQIRLACARLEIIAAMRAPIAAHTDARERVSRVRATLKSKKFHYKIR